jgi:hypothetical protein
MRLWLLSLCLVLAACSSASERIAQEVISPPDPAIAVKGLKQAAQEAKLAEPLEISQPIEAPAPSTLRWIICLRSGASDESKRRIYSVFFKNNDYVPASLRLSVILDRCDGQAFFPMNK